MRAQSREVRDRFRVLGLRLDQRLEPKPKALKLGMARKRWTMLGIESPDFGPLSASSLAEAWSPHCPCGSSCDLGTLLFQELASDSPVAPPKNCMPCLSVPCSEAFLTLVCTPGTPSAPSPFGQTTGLSVFSWLISLCPAPCSRVLGFRASWTHIGGCSGKGIERRVG